MGCYEGPTILKILPKEFLSLRAILNRSKKKIIRTRMKFLWLCLHISYGEIYDTEKSFICDFLLYTLEINECDLCDQSEARAVITRVAYHIHDQIRSIQSIYLLKKVFQSREFNQCELCEGLIHTSLIFIQEVGKKYLSFTASFSRQ